MLTEGTPNEANILLCEYENLLYVFQSFVAKEKNH